VIERILVVVLFGISILFMLLVLINLLRESLRANSRGEEPRRTHLTNLDRPIWSIVTPHMKRGLE